MEEEPVIKRDFNAREQFFNSKTRVPRNACLGDKTIDTHT